MLIDIKFTRHCIQGVLYADYQEGIAILFGSKEDHLTFIQKKMFSSSPIDGKSSREKLSFFKKWKNGNMDFIETCSEFVPMSCPLSCVNVKN